MSRCARRPCAQQYVFQADGEARVDRIRRRVADRKVGAVVILAVAVLGGVGGTIGGVREIIDPFDDESEPSTERTGPVRIDASELRTARNFRDGFSFQYPSPGSVRIL